MTSPGAITLVPRKGPREVFPCGGGENNLKFEIEAFLQMAAGPQNTGTAGPGAFTAAQSNAISTLSMGILDEARRQQGIVFPADCV